MAAVKNINERERDDSNDIVETADKPEVWASKMSMKELRHRADKIIGDMGVINRAVLSELIKRLNS